ncbi:hypothetical protein TGVAND_313277 [Toxoplasma gondii VAND]|uniref:Uncharacterized protein n=1 Tax=Toxoplasma gondii VAND TaxID=933077 RepID=A0A086QB09_TOXGO|nr:hypothetical protein TGVAND_313277 [Toxoplasma gondii VAND]
MVGEGVSTYGQQMQKWEKQRVNRYVPLAEKRKAAFQTEDPPRDREDVVTGQQFPHLHLATGVSIHNSTSFYLYTFVNALDALTRCRTTPFLLHAFSTGFSVSRSLAIFFGVCLEAALKILFGKHDTGPQKTQTRGARNTRWSRNRKSSGEGQKASSPHSSRLATRPELTIVVRGSRPISVFSHFFFSSVPCRPPPTRRDMQTALRLKGRLWRHACNSAYSYTHLIYTSVSTVFPSFI